MMNELTRDEYTLLLSYRSVIIQGHGRLMVEIRDGKAQMIEQTTKIKIS